jgi:hypothetical protein
MGESGRRVGANATTPQQLIPGVDVLVRVEEND